MHRDDTTSLNTLLMREHNNKKSVPYMLSVIYCRLRHKMTRKEQIQEPEHHLMKTGGIGLIKSVKLYS